MPATLTLKNIPDEIYERLKSTAAENRRSMNSEAILRLESALMPRRESPENRLERLRALRGRLKLRIRPGELDRFKRDGRA